MSSRVHFYAEQAFLSSVKRRINSINPIRDENDFYQEEEEAAISIIALVAAIESFMNIHTKNIDSPIFIAFESSSINYKIEKILGYGKQKIDWGQQPWQDILRLIKVRNWLVHFKDENIGLINSSGNWIVDDLNKLPKIDDSVELKLKSVINYYNKTIQCLKIMAKCLSLDYLDYLETENYQSYLVG